MNWRISKAAAVLFLSSFLISSCEDPTAIGLELQEPGSLIGTTFSDTATVTASTVLLSDSIITLGAVQVLAGKVEDPELGTVTAKTYAEMSLISSNVAFDPNSGNADSLVLQLDYGYSYGDTTQANTWNVHRLTTEFRDAATYFTTTSMGYDPEPLGSVTFTPRPRGTYVTRDANGDTLTENNPYVIRIKFDTEKGKALAREILAQSNKEALKTQQNFVSMLLKGLAIVPAANANNKSILGINFGSQLSNLTLYYTSTTDNKQKSYTFRNSPRYFNQIQADRSATPISGLATHGSSLLSSATQNQTYLQSGTGLVTKLHLPYVADFRKNMAGGTQDLLVNKAELIIPVKASSITGPFSLPSTIAVLEASTNNLISRSPNKFPTYLFGEGTGQAAVLEYRAKESVYVVNVTSYIQDLLYKRRNNTGLLLYPSNLAPDLATPTAFGQTINRAILEANQNASNTGTNKIRLKVYYSTPQ